MIIKLFEVRDRMTMIPVMAIRFSGAEALLLLKAGFAASENYVIVVKLNQVDAEYDPYNWSKSRTMCEAHKYIQSNWDKLESGDVIDVEFILGETQSPKTE